VGNRENADDYDDPLMMPVSRTVGWSAVHRMSQSPDRRGPIAAIRRSAAIRRGTRLITFLTPDQLAGLLHGWLVGGWGNYSGPVSMPSHDTPCGNLGYFDLADRKSYRTFPPGNYSGGGCGG
jgi:hypothetical protein